jgi:hypothetical protein
MIPLSRSSLALFVGALAAAATKTILTTLVFYALMIIAPGPMFPASVFGIAGIFALVTSLSYWLSNAAIAFLFLAFRPSMRSNQYSIIRLCMFLGVTMGMIGKPFGFAWVVLIISLGVCSLVWSAVYWLMIRSHLPGETPVAPTADSGREEDRPLEPVQTA